MVDLANRRCNDVKFPNVSNAKTRVSRMVATRVLLKRMEIVSRNYIQDNPACDPDKDITI